MIVIMTPFEAHILIQQASTAIIPSNAAACSSFPNIIDSDGSSSSNQAQTILREALKSHRLNPNLRFKNESLLSTTIKKGCPNLLSSFLEHGADPNLKSYENGRYEPALITAVRYKSLRCVQILLEYGANLSKTNFYGTDAVFQAVHENAFEILNCLLCHEQGQHHRENYFQQQKQNVPAAEFPLSSSSSSSFSPPAPHRPITIQKTTATIKGKDYKAGAARKGVATKVVLKGENLSNNHNRRKDNDDNDEEEEDDDHVLCPLYYALNYALSYPSKRASLALLLQSYYKCKCLEEIASCSGNGGGGGGSKRNSNRANNSLIENDQVKECLSVLLLAAPNFFPFSIHSTAAMAAEKSVPLASSTDIRGDDDDGSSVQQQHYYYRTHHHHDTFPVQADNENDIGFQLGGEIGGGEGGKQNELSNSWSHLFPYKVYKIQGKCHVIKENESSSSSSSSLPSASAATQEGASSSYVVLVGPLKLSCITREVIRDQIMRSTQTTCTSNAAAAVVISKSSTSENAQSTSSRSTTTTTPTTVAPQHQLPFHSAEIGEDVKVVKAEDEYYLGKRGKRSFRKSLETLMMPSSLMDYVLYRNIQWNNEGTSRNAPRRRIEKSVDDENNELSSSSNIVDNIKLIKRDLELNINYFAIYIY